MGLPSFLRWAAEDKRIAVLEKVVGSIQHTFDLEQLPEVVLAILREALDAEIACFYGNAGSDVVSALATYPPEFWNRSEVIEEFGSRRIDSGAIARAVSSREPVLVTDPAEAAKRGDYIPFDPSVQNELVVPIFVGKSVRGVLVLSRTSRPAFSTDDVVLCRLVASMLATAYRNAEDRDARERRIDLLKAIAGLNPDRQEESLTEFLQAVNKFFSARFTSLWLLNPYDDTLVIRAFEPTSLAGQAISLDDLDQKVLLIKDCLSAHTVRTAQPQVFRDIRLDSRYANRRFASKYGLEWMISFPILGYDGKVMGVVNVFPDASRSRVIDRDTLSAASLLVSQIASTMNLGSLRRRERLAASYEDVFRRMQESGDDVERWDSVAAITAHHLRCEACSVFVKDSRTGNLVLRGTTGLIDQPRHWQVSYQPGEGLTGRAFQLNQPIAYYRELSGRHSGLHKGLHRERLKTSDRSESIIFVPIRSVVGDARGVIRCVNKEYTLGRECGRFTADDIRLLGQIGEIVFSLFLRTASLLAKEEEHRLFLNRLHHEAITPLDGILKHMEWLLGVLGSRRGNLSEALPLIARRTEDVIEAVRLIDNIVRSIGDDRLDIVKRSPIDLLALLFTARGWVNFEARRHGVSVNVDTSYRATVLGDRRRLLRVFYNLLVNSLKYSDPTERARYVRLTLRRSGSNVIIDVKDNGIGIDGSAGDIFAQGIRGANAVDAFPEGTGLGLFFSRRIVELHGGTIRVARRAKATVFRITLPSADGGFE
jgi:signal transduction histidine kinase